MTALPEVDFLKLVSRGAVKQLLHTGTGEIVILDVTGAETYRLEFSSEGEGILMSDTYDNILAASKLSKHLCLGRRPDGSVDEHFVFNRETGESRWAKDIAEEYEVRAVQQTDVRGTPFTFQVYIFAAPIANGCTLWWALPRIVDIVFQGHARSNYVGKQKAGFERLFLEVGLPCDNLRASKQSLSTAKHRHNNDLRASDGGALQYWTVSTKGLIVLLLHWQLHPSKISGCKHSADLASSVLNALLDRACLAGPFGVSCCDGAVELHVDNGLVHLDVFKQSGHAGLRWLQERFVNENPSATSAHVGKLFYLLLECIQRPSKHKSMPKVFTASMLLSLLDTMHLQLELSKGEPWWGQTSCLQLAPLFDGQRRNLSAAYKDAIRTAARQTSLFQCGS